MTHLGMAIIFLATLFAQDNSLKENHIVEFITTYDPCSPDEYGDKLLNGLITLNNIMEKKWALSM